MGMSLTTVANYRNFATLDHVKISINFVEQFGHGGSPSYWVFCLLSIGFTGFAVQLFQTGARYGH